MSEMPKLLLTEKGTFVSHTTKLQKW